MQANQGDQLVQHGRVVGEHDKVAEITEVMGRGGGPPYRVRFEDGHEAVCSPGPDSEIRHRHEERQLTDRRQDQDPTTRAGYLT